MNRVVAVTACTLSCALISCSVYEKDALQRRAASTSAVRSTPNAGNQTVSGMLPSDASAAGRSSLDSGASQTNKNGAPSGLPEREAPQEGATKQGTIDAGVQTTPKAGSSTPRESLDSGKPMSSDAAAEDAARSSSDGGEPEQADASTTDTAADASAESGFCSACDNVAPAPPVLTEAGGTGNVTALGNVMSPQPSAGGACNYGTTAINYYASINANAQAGGAQGQWQGGRICGQCAAVRVKTEQGWKQTVVRIVDKCNDPDCGIALGGAPARDLMGDRPGRYEGSWRFVSCAEHADVSDGAPALRVKEGSSQWWSLVHVRNPVHAVSAIDWQSSDGMTAGIFAYATEAENYFSVPEAVHASGMIRLTIHYRDMSSKVVELSALQIGTAGAEIVLP